MRPVDLSLVLILLLVGCAKSPLLPPEASRLPERVELDDVPFFAQEDYQCGPAALATLLVHRGIPTSPEQLKDKVYLPGRQGSLQVELVAAARAREQLVYPLEPKLERILEEVAAGNPVLVMQNLAFDWWPQWHFAVVVGYDRAAQTLLLRSGATRRKETRLVAFLRTWQRAGRWAVVTVSPDQLPASAQLLPWLQAASDLEETGHGAAAQRAYHAATQAWPKRALPWFALGNGLHAAGDSRGGEQALVRSVQLEPGFAAGWFNLSEVLAGRGCMKAARQARRCASRLAPGDARFSAALPSGQEVERCVALPACS